MNGDRPIITLTTDFGTSDGFDAAMKAIILSICPDARIIDITHAIPPGGIEDAAFVLATAWPHFPPGTIHICVVDPAVGSGRASLLIRSGESAFIGPDNGVLSPALPDATRARTAEGAGPVNLPPHIEAFELENPEYQRIPVSATFHGRDVFAPAAAHLALGAEPDSFGPPQERVHALPPFRAHLEPTGVLAGRVIHVDHFGNLITNVRAEDLPPAFTAEIGGLVVRGPVPTFHAGMPWDMLIALVDSSGYLAIARPDGSAAATLAAGVGAAVLVVPRT